MKHLKLGLSLLLLATACTATPADESTPTETESVQAAVLETEAPTETLAPTQTPAPTPFPLDGEGNFAGDPQDFLLREEELDGAYAPEDQGSPSPNSRVLELRADGEAYIEATGRLDGWQRQYDAAGEADPPYFIMVVNTYQSAAGAEQVLSRAWHGDVWDRIDDGTLELLPGISGLAVEHLVWQDAQGTLAVEMVYRNLYIFFTGPSQGEDNYDFFAELARTHLDWIRARE